MLRQNRYIQTQYDAMMELRSIDERRESLHRRVQAHQGRGRSRRTQQDEGSSDESYVPTGLGEEVPPPPPEKDNNISEFEDEDQYIRPRAIAFTRRLNSWLGDIREQEGVIAAICRDAYRPAVLARLSPGEARDGNAASRDSADSVSQVEYVGPTRSSDLSLSLGCCGICGTRDEELGQVRAASDQISWH